MPISISTLQTNVLIPAIIIAGAILLRIADPAPVARLRMSAFDTYQRAAPRVADPTFPVRVVAIDEASLARLGQWPWPRTRLAEMVTKLKDAGARAIALDFVLAEPDRLSPDELARSLAATPGAGEIMAAMAKLPSNDAALAAALKVAPSVLALVGDTEGGGSMPPAKSGLAFAGDNPSAFVHAYKGGVASLPALLSAARGVGAANWLPSDDQIIRTVPLLVSVGGALYPSLSLETFRVGLNESTVFVKSSGASAMSAFGQKTGIEQVRVGKSVLPTDARGELWLKFAPADPRRTISAVRIIDGDFDKRDIAGRYVMIGATAAGLLDLRATPLEASTPGVEVHAQALEQILSGDSVVRPAYATGAELLSLSGIGGLIAWLLGRSGALLAAVLGGTAIAAVVILSWLAYTHAGLLFDPVYPAISVVLLYAASSLTTFVRSEKERARIRSAFSHYVAPPLVAELVKNHERLKLGGEAREVTLLFADVRGFSRFSETLGAEDLVRFINRLFTPLTETILANRGTIDKFMGDAVMAFWNAPLADPEHAKNACRAALAMLKDLEALNAQLAREASAAGLPFAPVRLGIGLNTGPCVVGNVGSPQRFDYSVLGDVVNVASRFEEATKTFGADIILGQATAAQVTDMALLELGTATPRGKDRPERIFALAGDESVASSPDFQQLRRVHADAILTGSNATSTARHRLEACLRLAPDTVRRFYQLALERTPAAADAEPRANLDT